MVGIRESLENSDILIVEDDPINLRMLMQICAKGGYRVHGAANGEQAISKANNLLPDLILLDIMLPDLNGYEVAVQLKGNEATHEIPIIYISARDDMDSKIKAFTSGGVDYVTKPVRMQEILARVELHLRLRYLNTQLQEELVEKESLISRLNQTNSQLTHEVEERKQAERRLESTLQLLKATLQRTRAMNSIARSLIGEETHEDILYTVAINLAKALPADRVIMVTLTEDKKDIDQYVVAGPGAELEMKPTIEQYMSGLSGWVIDKIQPVISPKGIPDPRESTSEQQERIRRNRGSVIVVPLYYRGNILGTIIAINSPKEWDFNQIHLDLIAAVASQAAVSISNLRLATETAFLKQFNEGIVQEVADAIFVTDSSLRITFANPAAIEMLGYEQTELIGHALSSVMAQPELLVNLPNKTNFTIDSYQGVETQLLPKTGGEISVLFSLQPLKDQATVTGLLATFTDVTALKDSAAALELYASELEAQNAELDAFAHTVAHDLKNPLTAMIGFSSILNERRLDMPESVINRHIGFIFRSAQTMNNIIRELLLLASVREQDEIPVTLLSMDEIINDVLNRMEFMIEENDAIIALPDSWPAAIGYGPWIEEVWVNYLSNGIKYGGRPDLGIAPQLTLGAEIVTPLTAADELRVRFWLRDNGPGLTIDETQKIFTPFERLHNVRTEGHGLGLSIVQRIVEKLDGEVDVDSTLGSGSTFSFTLPGSSTTKMIVY